MVFMRVISNVVIFMLLTVAIPIIAKANLTEEIVMCPKADKIHQAAATLNNVKCQEGLCYVNSKDPAFYENGLYWWLNLMNGVTASSEDEAALKAQNIAKEVTVMFSKTVFMHIFCGYYVTSSDPSNNAVIGIVAFGLNRKNQFPFIHSLLGN